MRKKTGSLHAAVRLAKSRRKGYLQKSMDQLTHFLEQLLSHSNGPSFFQLLAAMGVAYAGGVFSSFTPCVYPMIPITVGVIGGLSHVEGIPLGTRPWKRILFRALAYLGGMVV